MDEKNQVIKKYGYRNYALCLDYTYGWLMDYTYRELKRNGGKSLRIRNDISSGRYYILATEDCFRVKYYRELDEDGNIRTIEI